MAVSAPMRLWTLAPLLLMAWSMRADAQMQATARERARLLFEEGQQAYDAGDFAEAAAKMKEAYKLTREPTLAYNVGRVYERMSEFDDAMRFLRIYLRRGEPSDAERRDIRSRITALRDAQRRQREQVFTEPPSDDALTREARTFFLRGVAMYRRRQYEAAMHAFIAAHRFAPLPEVFFNMAKTAERIGSRQDAIDYYREYLRLRPDAADRGLVEREIARMRDR